MVCLSEHLPSGTRSGHDVVYHTCRLIKLVSCLSENVLTFPFLQIDLLGALN